MSIIKDIEEWNRKKLARIISTDYPTSPRFRDLSGKRFGRLLVERYHGKADTKEIYYWCICDCGNRLLISSSNLHNGTTKSCGCLLHEVSSIIHKGKPIQKTHGDYETRLYNIWTNIKQRTCNVNNRDYPKYGGRGITLCDEWKPAKSGYLAFKEWSYNNGYDDTKTIDRIDNDKGYSPDNCRWTNMKVQEANKRTNVYIRYQKWVYPLNIWSKLTGIPYKTIQDRKHGGWPDEDCILCSSSNNIRENKLKDIKINPYIADEFSECNKYDEWVRKGLIEPVKKTDYSKLEIKVNPKFNLRFI